MKTCELNNCGTVMDIDLTIDKDFGRIVVSLSVDEVKRLIDIIYDILPTKTPSDKKCKDFLNTRLFPGKIDMDINIIPELNKAMLKEWKKYNISKQQIPE